VADVRAAIVAVLGAALCALTACSAVEHDGPAAVHGVGEAIANAAHDHVTVKLPDVPHRIDLGSLRLDALQAKVRDVFGRNDTKQNVEIACRAKDLLVAQSGTTTEQAVREVLDSLNITRSDDQVAELARMTQQAAVTSADPHALGRAAVAWACQWASG
jgi:hypothetical protein